MILETVETYVVGGQESLTAIVEVLVDILLVILLAILVIGVHVGIFVAVVGLLVIHVGVTYYDRKRGFNDFKLFAYHLRPFSIVDFV